MLASRVSRLLPSQCPQCRYGCWTTAVRLRRQYGYPVEQVVIFLKPTTNAAALVEQFTDSNTVHRYRVIRLWEQDPSPLLQDAALLKKASLARAEAPVEL